MTLFLAVLTFLAGVLAGYLVSSYLWSSALDDALGMLESALGIVDDDR